MSLEQFSGPSGQVSDDFSDTETVGESVTDDNSSVYSYDTSASSIVPPRRRSPQEDIPLPIFANSYLLLCEFQGLLGCDKIFRADDFDNWHDHHVQHMRDKFPDKLMCTHCELEFHECQYESRREMFLLRMEHIHGEVLAHVRGPLQPDVWLAQHLLKIKVVSQRRFNQYFMANDPVPRHLRYPGFRPPSQSSSQPRAGSMVPRQVVPVPHRQRQTSGANNRR